MTVSRVWVESESPPTPSKPRSCCGLLIKDIRIHDQHTIIPTYRVPAAVRTTHGTVGDTGLETVCGGAGRRWTACLLSFDALRLAWVRSEWNLEWNLGVRWAVRRATHPRNLARREHEVRSEAYHTAHDDCR